MDTVLKIQNLKCGGCEATIIERLSKLPQIENVSVNLTLATVEFNNEREEDIQEVKKLLSNLGYPTYDDKNDVGKKVKSYVSCAIGRMKPKKII